HVKTEDRLPVLVDLTAAPGRTLVFTRTKRGAKTLTRQLIASGVPAVELHGNLAQNARTRNLEAFSDGSAKTLVATDIAARGIHVDDIRLVIHADPPLEHKAYLHRSGRTARAGADGTVVTLMTDGQVSDVRDLTRKAGIVPTTTRLRIGHPLLVELAPGTRLFVEPPPPSATPAAGGGSGSGRRRSPRPAGQGAPRRGSSGQSGKNASAGRSNQARPSGSGRSSSTATSAPARTGGAAAFSSGAAAGGRRGGR
ncbi:MAG TPA: C-terminal helicase domain-containing protein, partial [Candidatus Limnocylindria bacterium]|nr:C-terminal helicase domain-containing protein [Candidatus Limnocylindria bacterium]